MKDTARTIVWTITSLALCLAAMTTARAHAQIIDPVIEGEVLVRLHAGYAITDFNAQFGSSTLRSISSRNIHLLEVPSGMTGEQFLMMVESDPPDGYRWGEENYEGQDGESRTGSFYVSSLDAGNEFGGQWTWGQVDLGDAQTVTLGGGVHVAIVDTGVDPTHPFLQGKFMPGGYNFVDRNTNTNDVRDFMDNDGDGDIDEAWGHGTFVAGLIGFMAPEAKILPIRVLTSDGTGHNFIFAEGLFHAIDRGVDVINMSLGSTYDSLAVQDALNEARTRGIVVIGAGGNQNSNAQLTEEYPAVFEGALGLIATNQTDTRADFSNYHEDLGLSAPGVEIISTIPLNDDGHRYATWEGTSFSSAVTSGAAALVVAANPDLPSNDLGARLVFGALQQSAFPNGLGAGRLDAGNAVIFDPVTVGITDFNVVFGQHVRGGLTSLFERADGDVLEIDSQFGFSATQPNIVELRTGWASTGSPPQMEIKLFQWVNNQGGVGRIYLHNWSAGQFDQIASYAVPFGPPADRMRFENIPTGNYIRVSDGRIESKITNVVIATFSASGFRSYFDELSVDID